MKDKTKKELETEAAECEEKMQKAFSDAAWSAPLEPERSNI